MKLHPSNRSGFTLVEIMIVVAIIGLLTAIAIPNFQKTRERASYLVCFENLTQIEAAKQIWGMEQGKQNGDLATPEDLVGATLYIRTAPECPAGGTYSFGSIGTNAVCSIPGHELGGE
jgi:prepilin-type N-terminal cleavage/methylation domain-containing protein